MSDTELYDVRVHVAPSANPFHATGVPARRAWVIADNFCAAWGRRLPHSMSNPDRWVAELEADGSFTGGNDGIAIEVTPNQVPAARAGRSAPRVGRATV